MRRTIQELLKESQDFDKDKKFMAANDLCDELLSSKETLDVQIQKAICNVFIEHLKADSIEVQSKH